jgi:hypothetical protein
VIDYRKRPWLPVVVLLAWFAWLIGMSLLAQATFPFNAPASRQILALAVLGGMTFGAPLYLIIRWARRRKMAD